MEEPIIKRLEKLEKQSAEKNNKRFRLPSKSRINKFKLKKGYIIVQTIKENRNCDFERCQIEDSTYRTADGTYHFLNGNEILFLKGKPMIIQPVIKINPLDLIEGKNETRGQKTILARMIKDSIKMVKKGAGGMMMILVIGAVLFLVGKYVLKLF
jgi:hypothetical protein